MQLTIASLNLAGYADWQLRDQKIIEFLNEATPDVVLFQEVHFDASVSAHNQAASLNAQLASQFLYSQVTISKFYQTGSGRTYREGLAVLSTFPIESSEVLALNKHPDDKHTRIVQNIDMSVAGRKVGLSNIHLSSNRYASEQLAELLAILESRSEARIIVGDFNLFQLQEYAQLYGSEYVASIDFKNYVSFPSESSTLDYALTPKVEPFNSFEVVDGLSDHNALLFTIDLVST